MRQVYIIVISTVALILIICGIEFFTNNRHEENIITNANQNVVINQNLINNSLNNTTNQGVVNKKVLIM